MAAPATPAVLRAPAEMTAWSQAARARGERIAFVPTMGALHEGHRSLFRTARAESDVVVASLFVNPAQFDERSDLAAYPRDEEGDAEIAESEGVDVLFAPALEEIYPPGFGTWIDVDETGAEGVARPGHFRAVATVCVKLFNVVHPQRAYFGQKDAQQAAVLRRVVADLNVPVQIRVLPTVRDADGLALSSRNVHLSPAERERALALPRALHAAAGAADPVAAAIEHLNGLQPEYVDIVDLGDARVLAAAVRVGSTRLIDNVLLEGALS
jgi:pantoate--beta-alanine ligase